MGDRDRGGRGTRVYIGNLPPDVRERDIEGEAELRRQFFNLETTSFGVCCCFLQSQILSKNRFDDQNVFICFSDVFRKYGKISHCDLRTNKGPPFAFVDFDDTRSVCSFVEALQTRRHLLAKFI